MRQELAPDTVELIRSEDAIVARSLRRTGIGVNSVYDLVNSSEDYSVAIPVLLGALVECRSLRIREGIVRALTVPQARSMVGQALVDEYASMPQGEYRYENYKWVIGNALSVTADGQLFDSIQKLVLDKTHGWSRRELPLCFSNMPERRSDAVGALRQCLHDEDTRHGAMKALVRLRAIEAIPDLQELENHSDAETRRAARQAVKRLLKRDSR